MVKAGVPISALMNKGALHQRNYTISKLEKINSYRFTTIENAWIHVMSFVEIVPSIPVDNAIRFKLILPSQRMYFTKKLKIKRKQRENYYGESWIMLLTRSSILFAKTLRVFVKRNKYRIDPLFQKVNKNYGLEGVQVVVIVRYSSFIVDKCFRLSNQSSKFSRFRSVVPIVLFKLIM